MTTGSSTFETEFTIFAPEETLSSVDLLSPEGIKAQEEMASIIGASLGYGVDFVTDPNTDTYATTFDLESQTIQVLLSPEMLARVEAGKKWDFLAFAVGHEIRHVDDFKKRPPNRRESKKDSYFGNILDDMTNNMGMAGTTRYYADMIPEIYDNVLFPLDKRGAIDDKPKHMQLMESLLLLSMVTDSPYSKATAGASLDANIDQAGLANMSEEVRTALTRIHEFSFDENSSKFNLVAQLRAHGEDIDFRRQTIGPKIKELYDELYDQDRNEQKDGDSSEGDGNSDGQQNFDYSDSSGCEGHNHQDEAPSEKNDQESRSSTNEESGAGKNPPEDGQGNSGEENKGHSQDGGKANEGPEGESAKDGAPLDIASIAKEIAEAVSKTAAEAKESSAENVPQFTAEQLKQLQEELGLDDEDFKGYMEARNRYTGEISAISELIIKLKRERTEEFLAPSREVSSRGHRINVGKLVGFIASGARVSTPDIWKSTAFSEKVEHEFDGLDVYLLCDASLSMDGPKATEAAASAVVLLEGLMEAANIADVEEPLVRMHMEAFGAGHETLTELTDSPTMADLGRTYAALKNPNSDNTQVSGALNALEVEEMIPGAKRRLPLIVVVSDGGFHDDAEAIKAGQALSDKGAYILQFVYGGANVSALGENSKRINLDGAQSMPSELFKLMPELIELLRHNNA